MRLIHNVVKVALCYNHFKTQLALPFEENLIYPIEIQNHIHTPLPQLFRWIHLLHLNHLLAPRLVVVVSSALQCPPHCMLLIVGLRWPMGSTIRDLGFQLKRWTYWVDNLILIFCQCGTFVHIHLYNSLFKQHIKRGTTVSELYIDLKA